MLTLISAWLPAQALAQNTVRAGELVVEPPTLIALGVIPLVFIAKKLRNKAISFLKRYFWGMAPPDPRTAPDRLAVGYPAMLANIRGCGTRAPRSNGDQRHPWRWAFGWPKGRQNLIQQIFPRPDRMLTCSSRQAQREPRRSLRVGVCFSAPVEPAEGVPVEQGLSAQGCARKGC